MSCCGGNCGCGSSCSCGSGCKGCSMYPDLTLGENSATSPVLMAGAASHMGYVDEMVMVAGENDCKSGSNCTCDSCGCKEWHKTAQ